MKKVLILIISLLFSSVAFAATIHLISGKEISGTILDKDDRSVKIDVSGVQMTYYIDEIKDIDGNPPVVTQGKDTLDQQVKDVPQPTTEEPLAPSPSNETPSSKRELILKFIDVFGTRTAMERNFDEMLSSLTQQKPEDASKIKERFKIDEVIERLIPLYDKYFTEEDLQTYIDFYSSQKGKKLVSSIGSVMKDSIEVGSAYLKEKFPEMASTQ